jgi:hypothetical protein
MEPIDQAHRGESGRIEGPTGYIQHDEIDRSILEEHRGHRQRLLERIGRDDDQPLEPDASGDRLDRIEASSQIDVRGYPACGLNLGDCPQCESGLAARFVAPKSGGCDARQASQPEDCIQRAKPG